jgi:hypothetical protein
MGSRFIAVLALAAMLFGCASVQSPKDVVLSALDKSEKLNSLSADIVINMTAATQDGAVFSSGTVTQLISGARSRIDLSLAGVPELEGTDLRVYSLENGTFLCGKTDAWDCYAINGSIGIAGEAARGLGPIAEGGRKLLNSGAIEFIGGAESREVAGRKCTLISAKINYTKAREAEPVIAPSNLRSATVSQCLDDEAGIALLGAYTIEEETIDGGVAVTKLEMQVMRFEPNAQIPEEVFELPK